MSYILDALRKADAQRERDPARGIHAQPLRAGGPPLRRRIHGPWLWGAAALGIAALSSAGWYLSRDSGTAGSSAPGRVELAVRAPATGPAVDLPAPAPAPAPAPVVGSAVVPAPVPVPPVPAPDIEPPAPAPAPMVRSLNQQAPDPRASSLPTMRGGPQPGFATPAPPNPSGVVPPAVTAANPPVIGAPPSNAPTQAVPVAPARPAAAAPLQPGAGAPAQPGAAVPSQPAVNPPASGLPPDAPQLVISGGVYSTSPAQRMLIVNGQVFSEGSEVAPGVVVEEIKARTAVLRFRGSRFAVTY